MASPLKPDSTAGNPGLALRGAITPFRLNRLMEFTLAAILILHTSVLRLEGHRWWCQCGGWSPWVSDTNSIHNSQHLFDPYSFSHVQHGLLFCGLCAWLLPSVAVGWHFVAAMAVEAMWEMAENSSFVIDRYRTATIALNYYGDSLANSWGDILSCAIGFVAARYLGLWASIALFVIIEVTMAFWIRDSLLLNVLMLIHPIDAMKAWQSAH
ncbi:MAG TPA: DUF2585 family protein [Planctomycetaceae bacterium]|nr:DUF2585 family protein [Planctomycetaceae bacterium]